MSLSLSTTILNNSSLRRTALTAINNNIIKINNSHFYSTENGPKIEIPNLQSNEISNKLENDTINKTNLMDDSQILKKESLNENVDSNKLDKNTKEKKTATTNTTTKEDNDKTIKKQQNKKFNSGNYKYYNYYIIGALGICSLLPFYYLIRRRRNLNDYKISDIKRVKKVQKSYDPNMRQQIATYLYSLQNELVGIIEDIDNRVTFSRSNWNQRSNNSTGGGTTCNFENGKIFEKAAVQVNVESGSLSPFQVIELLATKPSIQIISKTLNDKFSYYKASLSTILYPQNPNVPTAFLDLAYNEVKNNSTGKIYWWFSGGNDFSESNLYMNKLDEISYKENDSFLEDYYQNFKNALDEFNPDYYPEFLKEGKNKTYISYRDEIRGIGGLYFNDLNDNEPQTLLSTVIQCFAQKTLEEFKPIIEKRNKISWNLSDKEKQTIKNSRLVEYELVSKLSSKINDSSLKSIDKILPMLPLNASWKKNKNEYSNDN
ncbi:Coproporphyrinogen III oxidase [Anaeromyces robustus]|uniref:coproporphyrinogen oxidase n=1 Tax=Anaeromyces robustus TaxID=1754192 RepID=A0A1Y1XNI4_9FUNG|nr:Coproporphyrinogen III oxidase [Anaeromyces robustus]|eukprot:ORX87308.1 Coproporphyrinogen III oxidase [Anaeromyces robustus]